MPVRCLYHHRKAVAVCHHCGLPLCGDINNLVSAEGSSPGPDQLFDFACGYLIPDDWFYVPRTRPDASKHKPKKPPAYHCLDCLKTYHADIIAKFSQPPGVRP